MDSWEVWETRLSTRLQEILTPADLHAIFQEIRYGSPLQNEKLFSLFSRIPDMTLAVALAQHLLEDRTLQEPDETLLRLYNQPFFERISRFLIREDIRCSPWVIAELAEQCLHRNPHHPKYPVLFHALPPEHQAIFAIQ